MIEVIKSGFYIVPKTKNSLEAIKKYSYRQGSNFDYKIVTSTKVGKDYIKFPRDIDKLKNVLGSLKIIDKTTKNNLTNFRKSDNLKLRPNQEIAVNKVIENLKNKGDCLLVAPCGFGKSFILPFIVEEINQKTLIIVDRKFLVEQMSKEFKHNSNGNYQIVKDKKLDITKDVYITTFQFLHRNADIVQELSKIVGFVIVDEAHILGAETYRDVLANLNHAYQLFVTATPTRSDGLTELLRDLFGSNEVVGLNKGLKVQWDILDLTSWRTKWDGNSFADAYSNIVCNEEFSKYVINLITQLKKENRQILLYTNYSIVMEYYKLLLEDIGLKVGIINSKVKKSDREEIINNFGDEELDIIISGVILNKGVSIERLDTIINLSTLTKENLEQLRGRLVREHSTKQKPLFIDIMFGGVLTKQCKQRYNDINKLVVKEKDSKRVVKFDKYIAL